MYNINNFHLTFALSGLLSLLVVLRPSPWTMYIDVSAEVVSLLNTHFVALVFRTESKPFPHLVAVAAACLEVFFVGSLFSC